MTMNVLNLWWEIIAVVSGAVILLAFGIALVLGHLPDVPPGSRGFRKEEEEGGAETIQPDGYIDSFSGVIQEAGGSLTPVVKLAFIGIIGWWLLYLVLNWVPHLFFFTENLWGPQ